MKKHRQKKSLSYRNPVIEVSDSREKVDPSYKAENGWMVNIAVLMFGEAKVRRVK